jgi:hypothetical protein
MKGIKASEQHNSPSLMEIINDPRGFILSLVGAEALAKRGEDGPLARPWRATPGPATLREEAEKKDGQRG